MNAKLTGYMRADGSVGLRNHLLVLPLTGCLQELARRIAESVPGAVPLLHPNGCDLQGPDFDLLGAMMRNLAVHPNVGGVLFLTMSCTATRTLRLPEAVAAGGRLVEEINMHRIGGTTKTIRAGVAAARKMVKELAKAKRAMAPVSALIIGTKCGSSNADSFAFCHPVLGEALDRVVDLGGTVVLSEDCELFAGARELAQRAANQPTADAILAMARQIREYWQNRFGIDFLAADAEQREKNRQRSLEHAAKAGTKPFQQLFDMRERVKGPGLVILNAPNTDLENMTSLAAAGCQLIVFTTGNGSVVGSPVAVTVKMTATAETARRMRENIDLDVSGFKQGTLSLAGAAERTFRKILMAANGQIQKAERLRHYEIAFPIRGVTF